MGLGDENSHFLLGYAYSKLAEWELARAELERINRPLANATWDRLKLRVHVATLMQSGNVEAARVLLCDPNHAAIVREDEELRRVSAELGQSD
jgi:hypothetical protein